MTSSPTYCSVFALLLQRRMTCAFRLHAHGSSVHLRQDAAGVALSGDLHGVAQSLALCFSVYGNEAMSSSWCISLQDIFYDRMLADPRVAHFFDGIDMKKQRAHQVSAPLRPLASSVHIILNVCAT